VAALTQKGINSQMKWRPSCKHGSARFSYEGLCVPDAFCYLMAAHLSDKETRKLEDTSVRTAVQKKLTVEQFEEVFGSCGASCRFSYLCINTPTVLVKFENQEGALKVTGGYGISRRYIE
jgi:hypothetical protein